MAWEIVKAFFIIVGVIVAVVVACFVLFLKWDDIKDGTEELGYMVVVCGFLYLGYLAIRAVFFSGS